MLNAIKIIFEMKGFLAGYKTYITAFAGVLAVAAQFITGSVIPMIDGDVSTYNFITSAIPSFIEQVAPFVGIGTLRAGISSK